MGTEVKVNKAPCVAPRHSEAEHFAKLGESLAASARGLDSEQADMVVECSRDIGLFAKVFLPEWVPVEYSRLHLELLRVLDDTRSRKVAVLGPRGWGKTTLMVTVNGARDICYNASPFIVPIGCTSGVISTHTENLRKELITNRRIHSVFGKLTGNPTEGAVRESFGREAWVASIVRSDGTVTKTMIFPRGSGQQIRGLLFNGRRPHRLYFDDVEDPETIDSEDVRAKQEKWLFGDALECVDQLSDTGWKIVYCDTLKHAKAAILKLKELPDWDFIELPICGDDFKTLCPEIFPQERLDKKIQSARESGTLDVFAMEFMCRPVSPETRRFKQEYFRYYEEDEADLNNHPAIRNVIIVDPARGVTGDNAFSAIVCAAVDIFKGVIYFRDVVTEKVQPDTLYNQAIDLAIRYNADVVGVEVTGLGDWVSQPFMNQMAVRGLAKCHFVELHAKKGQGEFAKKGGGKAGRVYGLLPYYRQGLIKHNKAACDVLEMQLLSYPNPKYWDAMDAAAYIIEVMKQGSLYFWADAVAQGEGQAGQPREMDEYAGQSPYEDGDESEEWVPVGIGEY